MRPWVSYVCVFPSYPDAACAGRYGTELAFWGVFAELSPRYLP